MMKTAQISFLCFALGLSVVWAQSKLEQANAAYDKFHYAEAIPLYEAVLRNEPRNGEAEEKLADSYRRIGNSREAENGMPK
ncbi:MAG: hypothetical protein HC913_01220 [Microscillaceae bacterium]|nr:hypothetical protein [Microscillaceae bacterium]